MKYKLLEHLSVPNIPLMKPSLSLAALSLQLTMKSATKASRLSKCVVFLASITKRNEIK